MPFGYNGKILHVDLGSGSWMVDIPPEDWYRRYMGGSNFASYFLLNEVTPQTDPLGPDNPLILAGSVVTGAPLSGYSRYTAAARSPLTGAFGESEAGGYWGPELKFAGFDAVVIRGRSPRPVYLWINDGNVEIRDAAAHWGKNNWQTQEGVKAELGRKWAKVLSIGPAGENLVLTANIMNNLEHANGRCGLGAVMGSKNLKAVAVEGSAKPEFADPDKVREIARWHNARIKVHPPNIILRNQGTSYLVRALNDAGMLPTRNFKHGVFGGFEGITWDAYEKIFHSSHTCYACTVRCKRRVEADGPYPLNKNWGGPEFEAIGAMGSLTCVDNIAAVARANQLCNLLGLDVIAAGCAVAFAMECFENAVLTKADFDGRDMSFGNAEGMLWLIEQIAHRRGIGDTLALGVKKAAEIIGGGAEKYAFHIKGSELPLHDGRGKTGMALGYAVSSTGADHIETPHDVAFTGEGIAKLYPLGFLEPIEPAVTDAAKTRFFVTGQKAWGINNVLGLCNFASVPIGAMTFEKLVEAVRAITGWDTSLYEIALASERSMTLSRMFNVRMGLDAADDKLIRRWHQPMPEGPLKGKCITEQELSEALELYYAMMGWDEKGRPTKAKLIELGLDWLAGEAAQ